MPDNVGVNRQQTRQQRLVSETLVSRCHRLNTPRDFKRPHAPWSQPACPCPTGRGDEAWQIRSVRPFLTGTASESARCLPCCNPRPNQSLALHPAADGWSRTKEEDYLDRRAVALRRRAT